MKKIKEMLDSFISWCKEDCLTNNGWWLADILISWTIIMSLIILLYFK